LTNRFCGVSSTLASPIGFSQRGDYWAATFGM
jgi:hypothetical protein